MFMLMLISTYQKRPNRILLEIRHELDLVGQARLVKTRTIKQKEKACLGSLQTRVSRSRFSQCISITYVLHEEWEGVSVLNYSNACLPTPPPQCTYETEKLLKSSQKKSQGRKIGATRNPKQPRS